MFAFDASGNALNKSSTNPAKYVLILNATDKTPIAKRAQTELDYAYVLYEAKGHSITDGYYQFGVLTNGNRETSLRVEATSGRVISGSGLYIYEPDSTNVYNTFKPTSVVNFVDGSSNAWTYGAGVLTLTNTIQPNGIASLTSAQGNSTHIGWNEKYYTVVDNVPIYIVNNSTGAVHSTSYTLSELKTLDNGNGYEDLYFELNQYGWIDMIYVVDKDLGTGTAGRGVTQLDSRYAVAYNSAINYGAMSVSNSGNTWNIVIHYDKMNAFIKEYSRNNNSSVLTGPAEQMQGGAGTPAGGGSASDKMWVGIQFALPNGTTNAGYKVTDNSNGTVIKSALPDNTKIVGANNNEYAIFFDVAKRNTASTGPFGALTEGYSYTVEIQAGSTLAVVGTYTVNVTVD